MRLVRYRFYKNIEFVYQGCKLGDNDWWLYNKNLTLYKPWFENMNWE